MSVGNPLVFQAIQEWLAAQGVAARQVHHVPTLTSEDSAKARCEPLRIGGKALLLSCDGDFRIFVLPADRKLDSTTIRRVLGLKKLRFATPAELLEKTGLVPGSVPPFGVPILPFPLFVDAAIAENDRIAFNAGLLTDSVILSTEDYLQIALPQQIFGFSLAPESG